MKKSIKNLICVASMATVIAASFCTVSAGTASYVLDNVNPNKQTQYNEFNNVNAVVGKTPACNGSAIGVNITIKSGSNYIGNIRQGKNESNKSYIQNISNCNTTTTIVCSGSGNGYCNGAITTS